MTSKSQLKYQKDHMEQGLCRYCNNDSVKGKTRCIECIKRDNIRQKKYNKRMRSWKKNPLAE